MDIFKMLKNKIVLVFLLFPFFKPRGIGEMATYVGGVWYGIDTFYTLAKFVSVCIIVLILVCYYRNFNLYILPILLFQIYTIGNDYFHGNNLSSSILSMAVWFVFILMMDLLIKNDTCEEFLGAVSFILFLLVFINLITIIMFPKGLYVDNRNWTLNWFLGYKNSHIYIQLPYIAFSALYYLKKENVLPLPFWISQIIVLASPIMCKSSTAAFVLFLVLFIIFIYNFRKASTRLNVITVFIFFSILSLLFVKYQFQNNFAGLIYVLFKKDATFTNRTEIWKNSADIFWQNRFWGVGNSCYYSTAVKMLVTQSHNMYLDIVYTGGMIGYALFLLMVIVSGVQAHNNRKNFAMTILTIVASAYFLLFVFEAKRGFDLFYIILLLFFYGQYYESNQVHTSRRRFKIIFK